MSRKFLTSIQDVLNYAVKCLLIIALTSSAFFVKNASAFEKTTEIKHINIAQEIIINKDILVSRPKPLDLKIHNIIDLNNIRTLEDYSDWLKNNIQYQHDGLKAVKTLSKAKGDCEDFSFLNMYVLKMLGYQPRFIAVQRPGKAHAICIFKHNGRYYWFDNAKLHKSNSESLQNFSQLITQRYNYKQVLELDLDTNSWQIIFQRS